ncbi:uncharacterized protein BJ212DRAFT_1484428 [Suillus subaureus]|uniref:Uncharacterized protein n=1 Tax=Suillus subaureus TaxID=48587 RepID=A0A9P7J926_9AGAM|nr:uncharacterized protein BJ212DRAFT_1484428 [Suillus subaureus]KAG1809305.1 hypothetical protein BJ212DRAFT_1484428 [Suillus subaureus]
MAEDKAVSADGKGGRAESDAEEEVRVPGSHKKKEKRKVLPVKMPVRDAIQAVGLIDESTMACDDHKKLDDVSTKDYGIAAERISGWRTDIPPAGSKPSSWLEEKIIYNAFQLLYSGGAPLTPIDTIANAGADNVADHFTTLFADNDLDESVKRSQALAHMSKPRAAQGSQDFF